MNKDAFRKFANDHRDQFDDKLPPARIWVQIAGSIFGGRTVSLWNSVSLWRAAALVLLGLSVYLALPMRQVFTAKAQQDFVDIESFYSAQISEKVALISDEGLFADDSFTQDLQKLEAMYTVLTEEMKKHPSDKVKDALVLNMLVRIDLLNQQIQKLEESKRAEVKPSSI